MKKAVIITPFDNYSYQVRIKYVERFLADRGYDVKILSSDFNHRNKTTYSTKRDNLELLHVPPYKKNLSYARICSHKVFSKRVLHRLEELEPDVVYCSGPPNFLFKYTSRYKRRHPEVKLIYELGDLWPETLPLSKKLKSLVKPVLSIWSALRDKNIGYADAVIYECQLFKDTVKPVKSSFLESVIYLSKDDYYKGCFVLEHVPATPLRFAYVGSVNNIIDIEAIVQILGEIKAKRAAELVLIGGGEHEEKLISMCREAGVKCENYGIIYDEEKKHNILSTCHFGLNIMKDSVVVGATMKSLEYFHEGLILVNNIKGDTTQIVNENNCGYNVCEKKIENVVNDIADMNLEDINNCRYNSRAAYELLFEPSSVKKRFEQVFNSIGV